MIEAHNAWIARGVADGVFLVVGSLEPNLGGAIIAHGVSLQDLEQRVNADPFVEHNIVIAEILEIARSKVDERLRFLLAPSVD